MSANEDIKQEALIHALAIRKYDRHLTQKIIDLLNEADASLVGKIAGRLAAIDERGAVLSSKVTRQLQSLLDEIRSVNAVAYKQVLGTLEDELGALALLEADFQASNITKALPVSIRVGIPTPTRLKTIVEQSPIGGSILSDWVDGMASDRVLKAEQAIRKGLVSGQTTDEIIRAIRGTAKARYTDGILQVSRNKAQALVRTAITHTTNQAAQETWRKNANVVKGRQFVATLDSRTSIRCGSLDGTFYELDDLSAIPPLHPNCRSITIPVTKSWQEMGYKKSELPEGTRASMDGAVPKTATFTQWLNGKDAPTQDRVLGKARADLFRAGKVDLKDLIDSDGSVMNLEQLRSTFQD